MAQAGYQTTSQSNGAAGAFQPQGIDIGDIVKAVLPVVLSTLSANPQMAPQFSIGGGININPFSAAPGALKPQGIDIGDIVKAVVPALVPVLLNAFSASPQMAPQFSIGGGININPFSAGPGALKPQGIDLGDIVKIVLPTVLNALSAAPQMRTQSAGPLQPQGIDIADVVSKVLPIVLSTLSAMPQFKAAA